LFSPLSKLAGRAMYFLICSDKQWHFSKKHQVSNKRNDFMVCTSTWLRLLWVCSLASYCTVNYRVTVRTSQSVLTLYLISCRLNKKTDWLFYNSLKLNHQSTLVDGVLLTWLVMTYKASIIGDSPCPRWNVELMKTIGVPVSLGVEPPWPPWSLIPWSPHTINSDRNPRALSWAKHDTRQSFYLFIRCLYMIYNNRNTQHFQKLAQQHITPLKSSF